MSSEISGAVARNGDDPVLLDVHDGIAALTLNRPGVGNALSLELAHGLVDQAHALGADESVRVVIIQARGRLFCAGGDVRAMYEAADRPAFLAELAGTMHAALIALRALPIPLIAKVQGPAAGGGLGVVLAADIAVAADTASFVTAYSAIGLSPDCGVTALLPATIGARRAALFALTNSTLSAAEAAAWGLITETQAPEALDERVAEIAGLIAGRPGSSAGQTAQLLRSSPQHPYAEQLAHEATTIARLSSTPESIAAITAFATRTP